MDFLSQNNPKHNKVEQGVILNEAYCLNPQGQVLFQDPFADFLETSKEGVYDAKNGLLHSLRKILSTVVQR